MLQSMHMTLYEEIFEIWCWTCKLCYLLQAEKELIDPKKTDVDVTVAPLEPLCCGVHELSYEVTLV